MPCNHPLSGFYVAFVCLFLRDFVCPLVAPAPVSCPCLPRAPGAMDLPAAWTSSRLVSEVILGGQRVAPDARNAAVLLQQRPAASQLYLRKLCSCTGGAGARTAVHSGRRLGFDGVNLLRRSSTPCPIRPTCSREFGTTTTGCIMSRGLDRSRERLGDRLVHGQHGARDAAVVRAHPRRALAIERLGGCRTAREEALQSS